MEKDLLCLRKGAFGLFWDLVIHTAEKTSCFIHKWSFLIGKKFFKFRHFYYKGLIGSEQ